MDLSRLHKFYFDYALQLEEPNYLFHVEDTVSGELVPMPFNHFKRIFENENYLNKLFNDSGFKKFLTLKRLNENE